MAGFRTGGSALLVVLALAACGGGRAPDDVSDSMAYRDQQALEARRAMLRGEVPYAAEVALPVAEAPPPPTALVAQPPAPAEDVTTIAALAIAAAEASPPEPTVTLASAPAAAEASTLPAAQTAPEPVIVSGAGPAVADYALATSHAVGQRRYIRNPLAQGRHERGCAAFQSADMAQDWFLQNGGPGRDRQGLDPDGDGYACGWNPAPIRAAAASP